MSTKEKQFRGSRNLKKKKKRKEKKKKFYVPGNDLWIDRRIDIAL